MATLPWENTTVFISEATRKIYDTYLSGEPAKVALSFALTLLINIVEMMKDREEAMDDIFRTLENYEKQLKTPSVEE